MEHVLNTAERIGTEHGLNAAEWWAQDAIGGRVTTGDPAPTAERVLGMMEDGDPALYDQIPQPDLSGEWADGYTPSALYEDCGIPDDADASEPSLTMDALRQDACQRYEDAFNMACEDRIAELCKHVLA